MADLITAGAILVAADSSGVFVPFDDDDDDDDDDKAMQESAWDQCLRTLHRMVDVHIRLPGTMHLPLLGSSSVTGVSPTLPCLGILRLVYM